MTTTASVPLDLRTLAGSTFKLTLDESAAIPGQSEADRRWLQQLPGRHGHVYQHGRDLLGAFTGTFNDGSNRLARLLEIPGARLHQRGDREASVTFPPAALAAVADVLVLRRRRRISDAQREALAARMEGINRKRADAA